MIGQDQRTGRTDAQALAHRHALLFQLGDFAQQRIRRQHHAIADQALHAFAQDARWNQVQDGFLAIDHQGVASVVTTLVANYGSRLLGEQVDDLALALITPLGAQDYDILTHNTCPHRGSSMPAAAGGISGRQRRHLPIAIAQRQLPVAARLARRSRILPGQSLDDTLPVAAQSLHRLPEPGPFGRRPDTRYSLVQPGLAESDQAFQIGGETGGRAARPKSAPISS